MQGKQKSRRDAEDSANAPGPRADSGILSSFGASPSGSGSAHANPARSPENPTAISTPNAASSTSRAYNISIPGAIGVPRAHRRYSSLSNVTNFEKDDLDFEDSTGLPEQDETDTEAGDEMHDNRDLDLPEPLEEELEAEFGTSLSRQQPDRRRESDASSNSNKSSGAMTVASRSQTGRSPPMYVVPTYSIGTSSRQDHARQRTLSDPSRLSSPLALSTVPGRTIGVPVSPIVAQPVGTTPSTKSGISAYSPPLQPLDASLFSKRMGPSSVTSTHSTSSSPASSPSAASAASLFSPPHVSGNATQTVRGGSVAASSPPSSVGVPTGQSPLAKVNHDRAYSAPSSGILPTVLSMQTPPGMSSTIANRDVPVPPVPMPLVGTPAQRLSTTPFLPSPLAQASMAPGEDENETMDGFGLDVSTLDEVDTSRDSTKRLRTIDTSTLSASAGIRRSSSMSQYKPSSSRRRISVTTPQAPGQIASTNTAVSLPMAGPSRQNSNSSNSSAGALGSGRGGTTGQDFQSREGSLLATSRGSTPTTASFDKNDVSLGTVKPSRIIRTSSYNQHIGDERAPGFSRESSEDSTRDGSTYSYPRDSPATSVSRASSGKFGSSSRPSPASSQIAYHFPSLTGRAGSAHVSPEATRSDLPDPTVGMANLSSPPQASPVSISSSSPGLEAPSNKGHRLSVSISASSNFLRGSHGRSDSLSSSTYSSSPASSKGFPSAPPLLPSASTFSSPSTSNAPLATNIAIGPAAVLSPVAMHSSVGSPPLSMSVKASDAGGIKLQRVPTSVRLAQDLHPVPAPTDQRRRISIDAAALSPKASATISTTSPSRRLASGFEIGSSSSSNSADSPVAETLRGETVRSDDEVGSIRRAQHEVEVPNVPLDVSSDLLNQQTGGTRNMLSSPFLSANTSPMDQPRGLALHSLGAEVNTDGPVLFPFSLPASSQRTQSTNIRRARSRSRGSPPAQRASPRSRNETWDQLSDVPETSVEPMFSHEPPIESLPTREDLGRRRLTLGPEAIRADRNSPSEKSKDAALGIVESSPTRERKKMFRTSMLPAESVSAASASTDDYARHLQESRASKLQRWANASIESAAGTTTISGSIIDIGSPSRGTRGAASVLDETTFQPPTQYLETSGGDIGIRPGTGGRDIEWVDWLDEYKRLKEAKLKAEHDLLDDCIEDVSTVDKLESASHSEPCFSTIQMDPNLRVSDIAMSASSPPVAAGTASKIDDASRKQPAFGMPPVATTENKKKRNLTLGSKIDAWWSTVTTSFSAATQSRTAKLPDKPEVRRSHSDQPPSINPLHMPSRADNLQLVGDSRSKQSISQGSPALLLAPPPVLRHARSATELNSGEAKAASPPSGALAPAGKWRSSGSVPVSGPHVRLSSAGSEESSGAGSNARSSGDFRRRNPQLSLRLDPRFQPAGSVHRLTDRPSMMLSNGSSSRTQSSASGPLSQDSPAIFKEPRPPVPALPAAVHERTPHFIPGQVPIWDKTPGLVPLTPNQAFKMSRSGSKLAAAPILTTPAPKEPATTAKLRVRENVRRQMTSAKRTCDKELRRIIDGISSYVENELGVERGLASTDSRQEEETDCETTHDEKLHNAPIDNYDSDAGNEGGDESDHRWQGKVRLPLLRKDTDSSLSGPGSASGSGSNVQSPSSYPQQPRYPSAAARGRTSGTSSPRRIFAGRRSVGGMAVKPADLAMRLEQSLALGRDEGLTTSQTTSRSTSRSRSPMPGASRSSATRAASAEWYHRRSEPQNDEREYFLNTLQTLVALALVIVDTSDMDMLADPSTCTHTIKKIQETGKRWDAHSNWPLRGWYIQTLLAVAGVSRVLEFWSAEREFWPDDQAQDVQPIMFISKTGHAGTPDDPPRRPRAASTVGGIAVPSTAAVNDPLRSANTGDLGLRMPNEGVGGFESGSDGDVPRATKDPVKVIKVKPQQTDTEVLNEAVAEVRSVTIMLEMSLDGESFQYISGVWKDVVGLEASVCIGQPISHLLHPDDADVFSLANAHMLEDDSHTVEAKFKLRVFAKDEDIEDIANAQFENMEGKGMLIRDRITGEPSHTMWVVTPGADSATSDDGQATIGRPGTASHLRAFSDAVGPIPMDEPRAVVPILCRICDKTVPAWFFEKHNETCNETHRLEIDIGDLNDRLAELRSSAMSILEALQTQVDSAINITSGMEYEGVPLLPSRFRPGQITFLQDLLSVFSIALGISTPSVTDDDTAIEEQRLLSPDSEDRIIALHKWHAPTSEDPALRKLAADMTHLGRQKVTIVNRLRNTIFYVERIRQEWERQAKTMQDSAQAGKVDNVATRTPSLSLGPNTVSTEALPLIDASFTETPVPHIVEKFSPSGVTSVLPSETDSSRELRREPVASEILNLSSSAQYPTTHKSTSTSAAIDHGNSPLITPLSPKVAAAPTHARSTKASSIKDFDIIKPISKGAFGSVYLAKKRTTGDYYAIKVLKKADMIAKNQVTNVKAERKIMMTQADSDFAVKLYWTFQSKDYLYLVMEYLNGGDCAALIKVMGCLDEQWAKSYIAEIILGLEYLHSRGIIHRDLKPDNLLIDSRGHLRLTDFGLSRFGLLGRQARAINQPASRNPSKRVKPTISRNVSQGGSAPPSGLSTPDSQTRPSYFGSVFEEGDAHSESSGSESISKDVRRVRSRGDSPSMSLTSSGQHLSKAADSPLKHNSDSHRVVGTVDYVAPESILGIGVGEAVDWWAVGVICHEFLTAFPPFHAATPDEIFDNILSRRIDWHEDEIEMSDEARDFIESLLCFDASRRLGANGADEVKRHPWLKDIDWVRLRDAEANFVPMTTDPESTDYFDSRGAIDHVFQDDSDAVDPVAGSVARNDNLVLAASEDHSRPGRHSERSAGDDFGTFNFKNLDVLKQANDDIVKKLRNEHIIPSEPIASTVASSTGSRGSVSMGSALSTDADKGAPPSPSTSATSSVVFGTNHQSSGQQVSHSRRPSEQNMTASKFKPILPLAMSEDLVSRRTSLSSQTPRHRSASDFVDDDKMTREGRQRAIGIIDHTPASSLSSPVSFPASLPPAANPTASPSTKTSPQFGQAPWEKTVDCLIAEDNPISSKILETILHRLGCLCVVVANGEEAIRCSMGDVAFDVIFMDMLMPILDGENAARMIKSTNNVNQNTPIVAVTSYTARDKPQMTGEGTVFSAVLSKPVNKADVLSVLNKLGFVAKTKQTGATGSPSAIMTTTSKSSPRRTAGPHPVQPNI